MCHFTSAHRLEGDCEVICMYQEERWVSDRARTYEFPLCGLFGGIVCVYIVEQDKEITQHIG